MGARGSLKLTFVRCRRARGSLSRSRDALSLSLSLHALLALSRALSSSLGTIADPPASRSTSSLFAPGTSASTARSGPPVGDVAAGVSAPSSAATDAIRPRRRRRRARPARTGRRPSAPWCRRRHARGWASSGPSRPRDDGARVGAGHVTPFCSRPWRRAVAPARLLWPLGVQPVAASTSSSSEEFGAVAAARALRLQPDGERGARARGGVDHQHGPAGGVRHREVGAGSAGKARTSRSSPPSRPSLALPTFIITPEGT